MEQDVAKFVATAETTRIKGVFDPIGIEALTRIANESDRILDYLRTEFKSDPRELRLRFSISEAAEMAGRSAQAIRDAEKLGKLPAPRLTESGRRDGYTLAEVNRMRQVFGTLPHRNPATDEPVIIACQSFKGGVGKSTFTVHLAHYLALRGYRVCVVDADSQATTTTMFGIRPDVDLGVGDTIHPYMAGEKESLHYALRETNWDQVKLIPANLQLYEMEYALFQYIASNPEEAIDTLLHLGRGIQAIASDFDVVLLDPPPALGMLSLSVLNAANAMIVPTRPSATDFASTAQFFRMLVQTFQSLMAHGRVEPRFKFLKVLVNAMDEAKSAHAAIGEMMTDVYAGARLDATMKNSAEIDNATARLMSVYELEAPITSRDVHRRCKAYLNAVNGEVELLIRKTWLSHRKALRDEGKL